MVPAHHCRQSLAINMFVDAAAATHLDAVTATTTATRDDTSSGCESVPANVIFANPCGWYPCTAEEDEEYMVDFSLELNEEWAAKLAATAQRLKIVSTPKKPSKAKLAHKKKTRAKSKLRRTQTGAVGVVSSAPAIVVDTEIENCIDR
jgi:hypothetical protein